VSVQTTVLAKFETMFRNLSGRTDRKHGTLSQFAWRMVDIRNAHLRSRI